MSQVNLKSTLAVQPTATVTINNSRQEIVNFYGDSLTAIQDPAGEIWVVANEILRLIGFDSKKIQNQSYAWNKDVVINRGTKILVAPTVSGEQNVVCLNRRYIPLALAKISITPTMQKEQPGIVAKLIRYQEECADVLYRHFYNKQTPDTPLTREEMAAYFTYMMSVFRDYSAAIDRRDQERENLLSSLTESQGEVNRRMINCMEVVGTAVNTVTEAVGSLANVANGISAHFDSLRKAMFAASSKTVTKKAAGADPRLKCTMKVAEVEKMFADFHKAARVISGGCDKTPDEILSEAVCTLKIKHPDLDDVYKTYGKTQYGDRVYMCAASDIFRQEMMNTLKTLDRKYRPEKYTARHSVISKPGTVVAAEIDRIPNGGAYRYVRVYNKMDEIGGVDVRELARCEAKRLGVNKVRVSHLIEKNPALMDLLRKTVAVMIAEGGAS